MKSGVASIGLLAFALVGCSPYVISYKHVCLAEENGLEILERSTRSNAPDGDELVFARAQLPIRSALKRPMYVVQIDTPQNPVPVVFLNARSPEGELLEIEGALVHRTHPQAVGYTYSFHVQEASGEPLEFLIRNSSGQVLGKESLRYTIQTRGIAYGVEGV